MAKKVTVITHRVDNQDFYCEIRGSGPTVALIPSGEGDCGSFSDIADALANDFTVFTLDMRGCSRTGRPVDWKPITPERLALDISLLIEAFDLGPASFYGCSSGGQACLALALHHKPIVRNLIIHEASLLLDTPNSSYSNNQNGEEMTAFFNSTIQSAINKRGSKPKVFFELLNAMAGDQTALSRFGEEYIERICKNADVWMDLYVPYAALATYTPEELQSMPPMVLSASMLSPAWIAESNQRIAKRAKAEFVWMPPPCLHFPHLTNPEQLTHHIKENTFRYL